MYQDFPLHSLRSTLAVQRPACV